MAELGLLIIKAQSSRLSGSKDYKEKNSKDSGGREPVHFSRSRRPVSTLCAHNAQTVLQARATLIVSDQCQ